MTEEKTRVTVPELDIIEGEAEFLVRADMPGARTEDIEINLDRDVLTVHAKAVPAEVRDLPLVYAEFEPADYELTLRVSRAVDREKITAELKDGVLTLRLGKAEEVKPQKIPVKTAA